MNNNLIFDEENVMNGPNIDENAIKDIEFDPFAGPDIDIDLGWDQSPPADYFDTNPDEEYECQQEIAREIELENERFLNNFEDHALNDKLNWELILDYFKNILKSDGTTVSKLNNFNEFDICEVYNEYKIKVKEIKKLTDEYDLMASIFNPIEFRFDKMFELINKEPNKDYINNKNQVYITNFISHIKNKSDKVDLLQNGIERTATYRNLVTMQEGLDIKIPIKYEKEIDWEGAKIKKHSWDYEYLIPPVQNIDLEGRIKINKDYIDESDLNEIKFSGNNSFLGGYSFLLSYKLNYEYFLITTILRPLIYLMRGNVTLYKNSDSFDITQINRIQTESRLTHTLIKYECEYGRINTFPNWVKELVGCKPEDLDEDKLKQIEAILVKLKEDIENVLQNVEINKYTKKQYPRMMRAYAGVLSVYLFYYYRTLNFKEVIQYFEILESMRESLRYRLFLQNINIKNKVEDFLTYSAGNAKNLNRSFFEYDFALDDLRVDIDTGRLDDDIYEYIKITFKDRQMSTEADNYDKRMDNINKSLMEI